MIELIRKIHRNLVSLLKYVSVFFHWITQTRMPRIHLHCL